MHTFEYELTLLGIVPFSHIARQIFMVIDTKDFLLIILNFRAETFLILKIYETIFLQDIFYSKCISCIQLKMDCMLCLLIILLSTGCIRNNSHLMVRHLRQWYLHLAIVLIWCEWCFYQTFYLSVWKIFISFFTDLKILNPFIIIIIISSYFFLFFFLLIFL